MPATHTPSLPSFESQIRARRTVVLTEIRAHLHSSDDQGKLALINHMEEVNDWVEADVLNDTDIALLGNELIELREIDAALLRIKAGTYGICTDCGVVIAAERLQAQLTAQRCIACQTESEKHHGITHNTSI